MSISSVSKHISPPQIIVIGYLGIILLGAILLNLPAASSFGESIGFLTAFFTSASAVCVTGLSVIEIGTALSLFGQITLLVLIQIGGLGFMITASLLFFLIGKRISLKERMVLQESMNENHLQGIVRMARNVIIVTAIIEGIGTLLLLIRFVPDFGIARGIFYSVFHSVSAFCNAGFDLLGRGDSLASYVSDPLVNFTIMGLIISGGIGFFVILELANHAVYTGRHKLSIHTKIALITTVLLIAAGFALFFVLEYSNPQTLGTLSPGGKIISALFESVTTRTAGFATVNQGNLLPESKLIAVILMFIGASPAGTGGGIKTTTFAAVTLAVVSIIRGQDDINIFERKLNKQIAMRAVAITFFGITLIGLFTVIMSVAESNAFSLGSLLFELTSAFGTVGLSTGITPQLSPFSLIVLIITMFAGRVGLLTLTIALANRFANKSQNKIKYPEDKIMVG